MGGNVLAQIQIWPFIYKKEINLSVCDLSLMIIKYKLKYELTEWIKFIPIFVVSLLRNTKLLHSRNETS